MNRALGNALVVALATSAIALPLAAAHTTIGDAGNTTGIRVDAHGLAYFNCGRGNVWGNPSMDLFVLGYGDFFADRDFYGTLGAIPSSCKSVGGALQLVVPLP